MKFMYQNIAALNFEDIIINPDLILRHEFVNMIVTTFGEVDIKYTAHQPPAYNPNGYTVLQLLP